MICRCRLEGASTPSVQVLADIIPINFRQIDSTAVSCQDWSELAETCLKIAADPDVGGIVIGHGTASLEETAWAPSLVLKVKKPVVLTGSTSRTDSGLVVDSNQNHRSSIIAGSDIGPVKARILLALCLARGDSRVEIERQFTSL
ncbi:MULTISPECIES: asparaginase domain-containing protein [unclassified Shinella]|uniref:asparaginase domain-containing protein n=1 Tax=unclassified Shinella TaxID=2643062 RepID=UPI0023705B69|nr:asparaginase domain-containing protein [Shinella sp. HY16]MDC7271478.1 asparaginase domain-containing protein [Shinella sp. YZ44]